jgi:hypothetical protein
MPPLIVPWWMLHANQSEASMRVLRPERGAPLDGDHTTSLQPAMRVKEHRNGEHPHS